MSPNGALERRSIIYSVLVFFKCWIRIPLRPILFLNCLTPGRNGRYRDYKYIFSKFKPYYTLRMDSRNAEEWEHVNYTSCLTFSDYIVAGCNTGQIKVLR